MAVYDLSVSTPAVANIATGDIINCSYCGVAKPVNLNKGTYKLECWGAQGATSEAGQIYGGKGGYSYGTLTLTSATLVYLNAGGCPAGPNGNEINSIYGGFNGGGYAANGMLGGGASDVRIAINTLYQRVIVAGGGGGGLGATSGMSLSYLGGYGGGLTGGSGAPGLTLVMTPAGYQGVQIPSGTGATQTAGGTGSFSGKFGTASVTVKSTAGGGGGGGWYGGGTGATGTFSSGGGGGSGFVWTGSNAPSGYRLNSSHYLSNAATIAGNASFVDYSGATVTGHIGHGAVRITVLEVEAAMKFYVKNNSNAFVKVNSAYVKTQNSGYQKINAIYVKNSSGIWVKS